MHRRRFIAHGATAVLAAAASRTGFAQAQLTAGRRLRVAQIGTAHAHASEKWATLRRLPELYDVVALCEPDPALQAKAAGQSVYAGAPWRSEAELFASRDLDAVLVETELPDLFRYGERVLSAGWHLHLDKPPGRSLAEFDRLQQQAVNARGILQHGYMYRYHPAIRFCLDAVAKGWLGRVFAVHGEMGKAIGADRRPWLAEHYGGSMMLLGCHLIDICVALLGAPQRVTAHRRNTFPDRDAFHDHEVAILEYAHGLATIRSMLAEVEGDERRQFVVAGENGTIEIRPLEPARLQIAFTNPPTGYQKGYQEVALPAVEGRYTEQLRDFAGMVEGKPSMLPAFDAAHERRVHAALLAAARSQVGERPSRSRGIR